MYDDDDMMICIMMCAKNYATYNVCEEFQTKFVSLRILISSWFDGDI